MAKFFKFAFAQAGIVTSVPNTTQTSGTVSYQAGYTSNYTLTYGSNPNAYPVDVGSMNQLFNDITGALQEWQTQAIPNFITSSDNGGSPYPYPIYALVRFDPGSGVKIYASTVDGNTTTPIDPSWQLVTSGGGFGVPVGTSLPYNGGTIPNGFLLEDNAIYNIVDYPNLFAVIGNQFGGDGITTFAVPPSARKVLMGSGGSATGIIGNTVGDMGGEEAHTQTLSELAAHVHPPLSPMSQFNGPPVVAGALATGVGDAYADAATTGSAGSGTPFNIIQPSRIVNWMIKY